MRSIAEAKAPYDGCPPGDETEDRVRVAGRLHARRGQGKAAFLDLDDRTGRMQLHARVDVLGEESLARCSTSTSATCWAPTAPSSAPAAASCR